MPIMNEKKKKKKTAEERSGICLLIAPVPVHCFSITFNSLNSANYSKSKNMSAGTVCIKRFKFACMTILSPGALSLVLCQWSIANMQVPPVPNQPKNAEILGQNALKMQIEATIYQNFSRERSPESPYHSGDTPSRALPLHWYSQCHCRSRTSSFWSIRTHFGQFVLNLK